jgi:hypothetical protein
MDPALPAEEITMCDARRTDMSVKMARMTKRKRTKYRRQAYAAGMLGKTSVSPTLLSRPDRPID